MARGMVLTVPAFDFGRLVCSHGWRLLAPFEWNERAKTLTRPFRLANGSSTSCLITVNRCGRGEAKVEVRAGSQTSAADRSAIRSQVRRMLSLDEDLSDFHAICRSDPVLRFVATTRCGRMLRSPTAFEDVVKTICTINTDWRNTVKMCSALSQMAGGDFPRPRDLLRFNDRQIAVRAPVGYRARTIREVAKMTEDGRLALDRWAESGEYEHVREVLRGVWGIGPYARDHILMMLGDYSTIPVDCEVLQYLRKTHFRGREVSPEHAVTPYDAYGRYRFLAFKFGRMSRKADYARAARGARNSA